MSINSFTPNGVLNTTYNSDINLMPGVQPGWMGERELFDHIEGQFLEVNDFEFRKDYLKIYLEHFLKYPPEDDIGNLESIMSWNEEDERSMSYNNMRFFLLRLFHNYGFSIDDNNSGEVDFEFLYILYKTFILNLPKTCALYLLGLKSPKNDIERNYKDFDLNNLDNDITIEQTLESLNLSAEESKNYIEKYKKSMEGFDKTILNSNNSLVFNKVVLKAFYDEEFTFDNFFKVILLYDEDNYDIELIDDLIDKGVVSINHLLLFDKIEKAFRFPSNLENLESSYKSIEDKRNNKLNNIIN